MLCNLVAGALGGILIPIGAGAGAGRSSGGVGHLRDTRSPTWSVSFHFLGIATLWFGLK